MDTNKTLEIKPSGMALLWDASLALGFLLPAVALTIVLSRTPNQSGAGGIRIEVLCLFVLATLLAIRAVRRAGAGPVAFLSTAGFRYRRMSKDTIPWSAITSIASKQQGSYTFMALTLDPHCKNAYRLSPLYRLSAAFGATELNVPLHRLRIAPGDLLAAANAYRTTALELPAPLATEFAAAPTVRPVAQKIPWATIGLLLVLVIAFVIEVQLAPPGQGANKLSAFTLARDGGMARILVLEGQWWRFFTAPLLHVGPGHLFNNALALVLGGVLLERRIGWQWFVAIFGFSALTGGAASCLYDGPLVVSVGASGGIVGLFVAVVVLAFREPEASGRNRLLALAMRLLLPTLIPTRAGSAMHVDIAAHLGGAAGGLVMGAVASAVWLPTEGRPRRGRLLSAASVAWIAASVLAVILDVIT